MNNKEYMLSILESVTSGSIVQLSLIGLKQLVEIADEHSKIEIVSILNKKYTVGLNPIFDVFVKECTLPKS